MKKSKQKELLIQLMKMDKKETSVDWLFDQLWETPKDKLSWFNILKEAKEMEKDQMINSYLAGKWDEKFTDRKSEEFYEQTYEKK